MTIYTDFTRRDFTSNFERLLALLTAEVPELTDRNHSDGGISLARLVARQTDMLSFYIDEAFIESFIDTARFKQSLIDIARTVDCPLKLAASSTSTVILTRNDTALEAPLVIPKYSVATRSDGIAYLTDAAVTFAVEDPEGDTRTVNITQGTRQTITIEPSDFISNLDLSGRPKYNLGAGVASGSVSIVETYDVAWTEVPSFWRSRDSDRHFMLEVYADLYDGVQDSVFLVLGDGTNGFGLPDGDLTVTFNVSDGLDGNCGVATITNTPAIASQHTTISNTVAATGGAPAESTKDYRLRIPAVVRTQRRGLTTSDYAALIESVSGVKHCAVIDRNSSSDWPYLYLFIYVVPEGGGPLTSQFKETLSLQCNSWGHLGDWSLRYIIDDAVEDPRDISCTIGVVSGYNSQDVVNNVAAVIEELFSLDNIGIGDTIRFVDIHYVVSRVPGVSFVEYPSNPHSEDYITTANSILTLSSVSVTVGT